MHVSSVWKIAVLAVVGLSHPASLQAQEPVDPPLVEAARAGDADRVRSLLAAGEPVDGMGAAPPGGCAATALHAAAAEGHVEVARLLLASGAPVDLPTSCGGTALSYGVRHLAMTRLLLAHGAAVDARSNSLTLPEGVIWYTPLTEALRIRPEWDLNLRNPEGAAELARLEAEGDSVVALLLAAGADPDRPAAREKYALQLAAENGRPGAVQLLLEHGARTDVRDAMGFTPLAMLNGCPSPEGRNARYREPHCVEVVRVLLEAGVDPDARSIPAMCGAGALHLAADRGDTAVVRLLLEHGANPDLGAHDKATPLHYAIAGCHRTRFVGNRSRTVEILLEHGADVNPAAVDGTTALALAMKRMSVMTERHAGSRNHAEQGYLADAERIVILLRARGAR